MAKKGNDPKPSRNPFTKASKKIEKAIDEIVDKPREEKIGKEAEKHLRDQEGKS